LLVGGSEVLNLVVELFLYLGELLDGEGVEVDWWAFVRSVVQISGTFMGKDIPVCWPFSPLPDMIAERLCCAGDDLPKS